VDARELTGIAYKKAARLKLSVMRRACESTDRAIADLRQSYETELRWIP
jgi:hypothetical protein